MAVWILETNQNNTFFKFIFEEDKIFFNEFVNDYFDENKRISNGWHTICLVRDEPRKDTDFFFIGESDVIAISQKALECFKGLLPNGEFLPIETDRGKYYALNSINVINCLDKESSNFTVANGGIIANYTFLEFKDELLGDEIIFKIPELPYMIFATDKVHEICEVENLRGLLFDPKANLVWYSE